MCNPRFRHFSLEVHLTPVIGHTCQKQSAADCATFRIRSNSVHDCARVLIGLFQLECHQIDADLSRRGICTTALVEVGLQYTLRWTLVLYSSGLYP